MGADDYIVKPFEAVELLARIEVVLRRTNRGNKTISFGDLEINPEDRIVKFNGCSVDLAPKSSLIASTTFTVKVSDWRLFPAN